MIHVYIEKEEGERRGETGINKQQKSSHTNRTRVTVSLNVKN